MLVLIGPSASGKSEIVKCLGKKYDIKKFITCTTREKRIGETDNVDYYFISKEKFNELYLKDEFIETVFYNGNYYGTLKTEADINKVVILEPQGFHNFKKKLDNIFAVFLYTDEQILKNRMISRGDSLLDINKRLENDKILFNKEQLESVNLFIDTCNYTIDEIADLIMTKYRQFLNK